MSDEQKPLHIVRLVAENVKRIRAVTITPTGEIVTIGGDNDAGKSSTLDCISMALGGGDQIPNEPVRRGAKKGRIVLDLGDIIVTRTFTKAGTSLVIEGKDGLPKKSPQELLNRLTGAVTFDPYAFIQLDPKKQLEVLRGLVKIDFTALDAKRSELFANRTLTGRGVDQAKALTISLPRHEGVPDAEVSVADLLKEIEDAEKVNRAADEANEGVRKAQETLDGHESQLSQARQNVTDLEATLVKAKKLVADLETIIGANKTRLSGQQQAAAALPRVDLVPLRARVSTAEDTNRKVRANVAYADAKKRLADNEARQQQLTRQIEAIDEEKQATLQATKFPVPGLSFGENGVLLDGLPFDQAGTAEQIRVSVAMAAATNPTIRVMLIKDGSLIGTKKLELIRELAIQHNLQVWMEVVSDRDDKKSTVVIEDGLVVGAELPPEESPEPTPAPKAEKKSTAPAGDLGLDLPPS